MMVTLKPSIHDSCISLFSDSLCGNLMINPVGEPPHVRAYFAKFTGTTGIVGNRVPKGVIEVAIVEEDIRVIVKPVKMPLD